MDKVPLCRNGIVIGDLTVEREGLYTCFSVRGQIPEDGLWSAWVIGGEGELRLGVLEPCGQYAEIRKRYSDRMVKPLGTVQRGEIRRTQSETSGAAHEESIPFRTLWLREMLRGTERYQIRQQESCHYLALPFGVNRPFPLPPLFCFARILRIGGEDCAVFCFDEAEWPEVPPEWAWSVFSSSKM